jgi:molybdopterin converting factor small subunit
MSIKVNLTPQFRDIVDKFDAVQASGNTIREIIEDIDRRYPGFKKECIDDRGKVHDFVEIYINQVSAYPDELNRKVSDNDEVSILTVIGGG